jgi:hypothetical protein
MGDDSLTAWLAERDALFRDLTEESANQWWNRQGHPRPTEPTVPLAACHKARLQWLGATDAELAESVQWLREHGYTAAWHGAPPLTPEQRDAERATHGKPPLGT